MAKITHFELYTDRGSGWKLEQRFTSSQKDEAMLMARDKERSGFAVKLVKESFDVHANSYNESVQYVGGLNGKKKPKGNAGIVKSTNPRKKVKLPPKQPQMTIHYSDVLMAVTKLLVIVILCLVFANFVVSLLEPVVDNFVTENQRKNVMFLLFFFIFLFLAVPLVVTRIPWYVFGIKIGGDARLNESRIYKKAQSIIELYNFNDKNNQEIVTPIHPEASIEDKKHIVEFLGIVVSTLNKEGGIRDSFSKFGIKLVVFGGCLELSRENGLTLSKANSLLYEAFKIIDGDSVDLEAFYEAKRSFRDNKVAIFLTGVGALMMANIIRGKPIENKTLSLTFEKWQSQNQDKSSAPKDTEANLPKQKIDCACTVNLQNITKLYDETDSTNSNQIAAIRSAIRNIIHNKSKVFKGRNIKEENNVISIDFKDLDTAITLASELFDDIIVYQEDLDDENIIIENKCNIIPSSKDLKYALDIFEHSYDDEIIVPEAIKENTIDVRYNFDFLGTKWLQNTEENVSLYKLLQ